jgi:REP element-mobilizing transposase RayT
MDRYWLLTWTTYGTWLPGDERGFVGRTRDHDGRQTWQNTPGTPARTPNPSLRRIARARMSGAVRRLAPDHARVLLADFCRTAEVHFWDLIAVAVMRNHVHLVVGVAGDPDPSDLLRHFKTYGSKTLSRAAGRPDNGRWWTQSGSRRVLRDDAAVIAAIRYVLTQHEPLLTWNRPDLAPSWLPE